MNTFSYKLIYVKITNKCILAISKMFVPTLRSSIIWDLGGREMHIPPRETILLIWFKCQSLQSPSKVWSSPSFLQWSQWEWKMLGNRQKFSASDHIEPPVLWHLTQYKHQTKPCFNPMAPSAVSVTAVCCPLVWNASTFPYYEVRISLLVFF